MREIMFDFMVVVGVAGLTYGAFFIWGQGVAAMVGGGFALAGGVLGNLVGAKNADSNI